MTTRGGRRRTGRPYSTGQEGGRPPAEVADRERETGRTLGLPRTDAAETGQPRTGGIRIEALDPRIIVWPPGRVTSEYDAEASAGLRQSIAEAGQQDLLLVYQRPDGVYEGAAGYNRCQAAIDEGQTTIMCQVRQGAHREVVLTNLITGLVQARPNPASEVEAVAHAVREEGIDLAEMMRSTGKSQGWIEDRLLIADASPAVLECLREGRIAIGHAALLARLADRATQEEFLGQQLAHGWTVEQLREAIRSGEDPEEDDDDEDTEHVEFEARRTPRAERPAEPVTCESCQESVDPAQSQTVHLCGSCAAPLRERLRSARPGWTALPLDLARDAQKALAESGNLHAGMVGERIANLLEERGASPEPTGRDDEDYDDGDYPMEEEDYESEEDDHDPTD